MLLRHEDTLSTAVINSVTTSIQCARDKNLFLHDKLTIIDYSLPSNQKRLWVFDLETKRLLFHTYVSHGIKSGTKYTNYFSNKVNSKATSLGVYTAEKSYYGRHGLSLKLHGKERNFNDRAYGRAIVMHGAWYMSDSFIKRYGRAGRSWGCPALPLKLAKPIINTIKDGSLFVVYYPSLKWQTQSNYLSCNKLSYRANGLASKVLPTEPAAENRGEIYYLDRNNNQRREEHDPVIVMAAADYESYFKTQVPLKRMLRRQINKTEYVVLNSTELQELDSTQFDKLNFAYPMIKRIGGYYSGTYFKFMKLGDVDAISSVANLNQDAPNYTIRFSNNQTKLLRPSEHFIRWIGL